MEQNLNMNLKNANLKVTPQRLAIYSYLVNTNIHPCAEQIYNALKPEYPSMSLATVYKNVMALRNAHLINEFNVGEDNHRYDGNTDFHIHLVCKHCHQIYDYNANVFLNDIEKDLKNRLNFNVDTEAVILYGTCNDCKDSEENI